LSQYDPDIDPELNKYPPLLAYGFGVVSQATTLITTNIATATASVATVTTDVFRKNWIMNAKEIS
jgi:hypothetical protein